MNSHYRLIFNSDRITERILNHSMYNVKCPTMFITFPVFFRDITWSIFDQLIDEKVRGR